MPDPIIPAASPAATPGENPLRYAHVLQAVSETPWAIMPETLATIMDVLSFRATGGRLTAEEIETRITTGVTATTNTPNFPSSAAANVQGKAGAVAVAILSLHGIIAHRASAFNDVSAPAGTSVERFTQIFREAMNNADIGAILIDVQSPGGSVMGVTELVTEIREARGTKPIVAVANAYAASAAYWIATAADELVITPSGEVGSIGVFAAHTEFSKHLEMIGRKTTLISAGKFKVEGNPFEPLTDEAKAYIQSQVNDLYGVFTADVAQARGVTAADVKAGFGQGRMVMARDAVAMGMADRVDTFDNTLARLLAGPAGDGTGGVSPGGSRGKAARRSFDFA